MHSFNIQLLHKAIWVIVFFAFVISIDNPAKAGSGEEVTLLITNAPSKNSADYMKLVRIAGRPPTRILDLTKCEIWKVPSDKVELLTRVAAVRGSVVTRLGDDWNTAFRPISSSSEMTTLQSKLLKEAMRSSAARSAVVLDSPKSNVFEYALTKDMFSTTDGTTPSQIMIPLRSDLTVTVRRTAIKQSKGRFVWWGDIDNKLGSATLMWWPSGRITGTIRYKGRIYVIKHLGGHRHCVVEMVPSLLPSEHAPMTASMKKKMGMATDPLVKHGDASMIESMQVLEREQPKANRSKRSVKVDPNHVTITLLVAYTRKAASHYTDIENDLIALAIEDANHSFRNSGIKNVKLKVVHAFEVDYSEKGSHFDHLYDLLIKNDGKLEEAHVLRNTHRADVALLIVHDPQGCGLAAKVRADESRAFAVVHHGCAATSYSLAHELGHIIGARHDTALDDSNDPYPYGHGFINGSKWRTMMSYKDGCNNCPRVPSWSNPNTRINGVRTGDSTSNNARVIREQAARVAEFR